MTTATTTHDRLTWLERQARQRFGAPTRPPGPPSLLMPWTLQEFFDKKIGMFEELKATYGDVAFVRFGHLANYLINDPALIEQVLVKRNDDFRKDDLLAELEVVLGQGLLTSEPPLWKRQRRLAAPSLKRRQIAAYADDMVRLTSDWTSGVRVGTRVDLHAEMMALTLKIVVKTLFGLEIESQVERIGHLVDAVMLMFDQEIHSWQGLIPRSIVTPRRRRFNEAVAELDGVILGLIRDRKASGHDGDDLLWRLIQARDEDGQAMDEQQLRDEAITMFMAGHETTALTITYAWELLARHPEHAARLFEEVQEVLGGRAATVEDVPKLTVTEAIIKESMRLKPPAWMIGRAAKRDVRIGEWLIPEGSQVLMSQRIVHRDARWYPDPHAFRPERWTDGSTDDNPRFAYFPFGGGARVCIGNHFAMMEAVLVVATMAQAIAFQKVDDKPMRFLPAVTMRPADPVWLRTMPAGSAR